LTVAAQDGGGGQPGAASRQLEWYRESTKWLVTISGAAIVLGLGWVVDGKFAVVGKSLFSLAGGCLLLCCGFGILAVFKMADYEGSRQNGGDADPRAIADRTAANRWFKCTFAAFFVGLWALVSAGYWLIWIEGDRSGQEKRFGFFETAPDARTIGMLIDHKTSQAWTVKRDPASQAVTIEPAR
jgi:hypothetical protein